MELTIRPDQSARIRQGYFEGSRQRLTGREQELIQLWQSRVVVGGRAVIALRSSRSLRSGGEGHRLSG